MYLEVCDDEDSAGDVSSDSGDGTADCAHLGFFTPLDVDLRILPKELDEKVAL